MVTAERVNTDHADKLAGAIKSASKHVTPLLSNQEPLTVVLRFDSKEHYDAMGAELKAGKLQPLLPQITGYEITRLERKTETKNDYSFFDLCLLAIFQTAAHSLSHVEIKPLQFQFAHVISAIHTMIGRFSELLNFMSFTCESNPPSSVALPALEEQHVINDDDVSGGDDDVDDASGDIPSSSSSKRSRIDAFRQQVSLCILLIVPADLDAHARTMRRAFASRSFYRVRATSGMTPSQQYEKYYAYPHVPEYPLSTLPLFGLYARPRSSGGGAATESAALRLNMYVSCDLVIMEQFYSSILDQRPFKGREGHRFFLIYSLSSALASNVELYIYYCPECKIVVTEGVTLHFVVADLVLAANQLGENLLKKLGPSSYMTVDPQEHLVVLHSV